VGVVGDIVWAAHIGRQNVIPDDKFKEDEVQRGDFRGPDKKEEIEDTDVGFGEQNHIGPGYGSHRTAGPKDGVAFEPNMADTAKNGTTQVKKQISYIAQFTVDVVSKHVEKKHVSQDVHPVGMEKGISDELVQHGGLRLEHELLEDLNFRIGGIAMQKGHGGDKNGHIEADY
jgi:hypothetical protein